jgi:phosphoribosylaminoimidazolecarboxamide formyltransferase/IMP cyclohydrolase
MPADARENEEAAPDGLVPVRRALLSVFDKTGLAEFAGALHHEFHVELISTGGTAQFLRAAGLPVTDVSAVTNFPEMLDGRVKTLHPAIHGGLLAVRDNPQHAAALAAHGIQLIDLVCINLYPFAQTIETPGVTLEEAIENIDIGGPAMIRSAAKNNRFVLVVTAASHYGKVLGDLRKHGGSSCAKHRLKQAQRAFAQTAEYDGMIAKYLAKVVTPSADWVDAASPLPADANRLPDQLHLDLVKQQELRYGENPHQQAGLYVERGAVAAGSVAGARQLHGKELSYINLLDADAALAAAMELSTPTACIVKHATPCGYATAPTMAAAFRAAYATDPLAAFGGIVAVNRAVDLPTAEAITGIDKLLEVIVAPAFADDALALLKERWKNVRLLAVGELPGAEAPADGLHIHKIVGGYLVQARDQCGSTDADAAGWKVVSQRAPSAAEWSDLKLAWAAAKHVKSNAIVLAKSVAAVGIGGGQVDRVNAARLAIYKAGARAGGAVAASDAFFPFPDGPELLLAAGVSALIHPGGSVRDAATLQVVNAAGAAMVVTGQRHFRH